MTTTEERMLEALARRFQGTAFGSFEGVLELIDVRRGGHKAVLTLRAGGLEIPCTVGSMDFDELIVAVRKPATAYGVATYDGTNLLPVSLDIRDITVHKGVRPLAEWRGAFEIPPGEDDEEDWA